MNQFSFKAGMLWYILLACFLFGACYCGEPHCSRFHYDDQLLDKMIRMEVKFEALEKEILKAKSEVLESQDALANDIEKAKSDYANWKSMLNAEWKAAKETLLTPTLVFKARQPADVSLETGQTVVFNKIMENTGDAYDNVTGIFTAPIGGTYIFIAHFCVHNQKSLFYGIVVDNIVYTSGRHYEDSASTCITADAMLALKAGQKVWVKCLHGSSGNVLYEYSGTTNNYWNTFSGTLVHI